MSKSSPPITLAMLAHAFLAVTAAHAREKGEVSGTRPTSWTSHQPRFAVCWHLPTPALPHGVTTR
ncbi:MULTISPECIES: hypothetical protein [unclassified Streptomyces]|uniref:hypothetical protein n=1 Tax=Streptomyces sp. NPDC088748 TaxID=3365887 RepID=UPI0009A48D15|nr:hypothetical protein [Streptomyces sp. 3211]